MSPFDFTVYNSMQLLGGVEATDLLRASLAQNLSQVRFISVYSVGQYHNQFHAYLMKGTKVLTLGAVGVYKPVFSRFHGLAIMHQQVALRMRKFVGEYTYMRVHEKYACGTETQLPASRKQ